MTQEHQVHEAGEMGPGASGAPTCREVHTTHSMGPGEQGKTCSPGAGHRKPQEPSQAMKQRGPRTSNPNTTHPCLWPPRRPSHQVSSWLRPGTYCGLGHNIKVLKFAIESEISAHCRTPLDSLCRIGVAIAPRAQVHLRSETTRSGPKSMAIDQRPPPPKTEAI